MALATPITRDGFIFSGDTFAALVNGNNIHHAAPPSPSCWPTSTRTRTGPATAVQVKGTAKMRLLDSVKGSAGPALAVPDSINKLEAGIKKEWMANNKAGAAPAKVAPAKAAPALGKGAGSKRKASENEDHQARSGMYGSNGSSVAKNDVNINLSFSGFPPSMNTQEKPAAKKTKPTPKTSTPKAPAPKSPAPKAPTPQAPEPKAPRTKQTARRSTFSGPGGARGTTRGGARGGTRGGVRGGVRGGARGASRGGAKQTARRNPPAETTQDSYNEYDQYDDDGHNGYDGYDDNNGYVYETAPPPYPGSPYRDHDEWY